MLEIRRPICHWKKNNLVLEPDDGGLVLCNPDKGEIKDLKFQSCSWCVRVFYYKESLVLIKDVEHAGAQVGHRNGFLLALGK